MSFPVPGAFAIRGVDAPESPEDNPDLLALGANGDPEAPAPPLPPTSMVSTDLLDRALQASLQETDDAWNELQAAQVAALDANHPALADGDPASFFAGDTPLVAELYQQREVVDAAIVNEYVEDEDDDPKTICRLRMVFAAVILFSLTGIALVVVSVVRGFGDQTSNDDGMRVPVIEGWQAVGRPLFADDPAPLLLYGSAVALSGQGQRLAVAAPGTDQDELLDVGAVHIYEHVSAGQDPAVDMEGPPLEDEEETSLGGNAEHYNLGWTTRSETDHCLYHQSLECSL